MHKLLDLRDIAEREEARLATAIADVSREWRPLASGMMARGEPGTWVNTAAGVGFGGCPEPGELEEMIAWYEEVGVEPRIEVCPFADPRLRDLLADRGFVVRVFENVLFRVLRAGERVMPVQAAAVPIEIRTIEHGDRERIREYGVTVASGFAAEGVPPREEDIDLAVRCAVHPRTTAFGAYLDGRCIAGGGLEVAGDISALFGLSVLPEYRRKGIQQALIAARLNLAAARGAKIATIGSRPGVPTERNVRRMGFQVAYTKVALVRPGAHLARVMEL